LREEKEEPKLEKGDSSNQYFQHLFKMEERFKIKPYEGEVDALKLNHWLQQLEVYFSVHNV
jgi:hypothetical protein